MVAKRPTVVAHGKGVTNCTPGSVVECKVKTGVSLTFRWFPAYSTSLLEKDAKSSDASNKLNGLPFVVGMMTGGKFAVFDPKKPKASRLPEFIVAVGKLQKGSFVVAPESIRNKLRELSQYKKAHPHPKDEAGRKKSKELDALHEEGWRNVNLHRLKINNLAPETVIGVCIGVDSKTKFRRYALWQVKTGDKDVVLDILETYGHKYALDDKARKTETRDEGSPDKPHLVDYWTARLTGDLWMRSTHPFTEADVDALPAAQTSAAMKTALKKIYTANFESVGRDFALDVPKDATGTVKVRLHWSAGENANCTDNVTALNVKAEVPRRIHPAAYAAAARAAHSAGVKEINFTSSWRPMLGSMGHRTGRGLDITWLRGENNLHLNRKGLGGKATATISQDEQGAFKAKEAAMAERDAAEQANKAAKKAVHAAELNHAAGKLNAPGLAAIRKQAEEAVGRLEDAKTAETEADKKWSKAVKANQPAMLDSYRKALIDARPLVTQVLDPWYMETNTRDAVDKVPNEQKDGLAKQHNNHMHITINDPELE